MRGTSKTDSVRSPKFLLKAIRKEFGKFYDPAPYNPKFDPKKFDGLTTEWKAVNYVNPPYSKTRPWFAKAFEQWKKGRTVIMFVKLSTLGTLFAKEFVPGAEIRIFSKKFSFPGYDKQAAFTNVLIIWRANKKSQKFSII